MADATDTRSSTRERIVDVAARLLGEGGQAAVTTRGVAERAGVQAPTIYRLFGDKDGLLDAVAEHVLAVYAADKAVAADSGDPVEVLRGAWHTHIGFGLANPALFALIADPGRGSRSPAAAAGMEVLRTRMHRLAATGRLRVTERRAVDLFQAASPGPVFPLLSMAPQDRDPGLADAMYDAVMQAILTDAPALPQESTTAAAVTFRTLVPGLATLSDAERALLSEWLDRVSA